MFTRHVYEGQLRGSTWPREPVISRGHVGDTAFRPEGPKTEQIWTARWNQNTITQRLPPIPQPYNNPNSPHFLTPHHAHITPITIYIQKGNPSSLVNVPLPLITIAQMLPSLLFCLSTWFILQPLMQSKQGWDINLLSAQGLKYQTQKNWYFMPEINCFTEDIVYSF